MPKKNIKRKSSKKPKKEAPSKKQPVSQKDIKALVSKRHPIETLLKLIIALSIFGLLVAGYLIYMHYRPEASKICTFEGKLNCDVVNKSAYAEFFGIPNSMIGAVGYIYFIIVSMIMLKGYDLSRIHPKLRAKHLNFLVILFAGLGWLFSLYLLYIEKFVLHAYCIFCLASLAIITAIFFLSIFSYNHCRKCKNIINRIHYKSKGKICKYC